jgi:DNA-binding protein Fis
MDKPALPLAAVERAHIHRILEETDGNRTRAAEILGITRQTLINKLKMYGDPAAADSEKSGAVEP